MDIHDAIGAEIESRARAAIEQLPHVKEAVDTAFAIGGRLGSAMFEKRLNAALCTYFQDTAQGMLAAMRDFLGQEAPNSAALLQSTLDHLSPEFAAFYWKDHPDKKPRFNDELINQLAEISASVIRRLHFTASPSAATITVTGDRSNVAIAAGVGNVVHQQVTGAELQDLLSAIVALRASFEAAGWSEADRDQALVTADAFETEVAKAEPDPSKLKRAGKRLLEWTEKVGQGVTVATINAILKNHGLF